MMKAKKRLIHYFIISVFLGAGLSFLLPLAAKAGEGKPVTRDDLQMILQKLEEVSRRIDKIEKEKAKAVRTAPPSSSQVAKEVKTLKEDFDDIVDRLDEVELKSILSKVQVGGEVRFRNDFLQMKDKRTSDTNRSDDNWSTRFRLHLKSNITDNIIFHGRLTSFKMWGDSTSEDLVGANRMAIEPSLVSPKVIVPFEA